MNTLERPVTAKAVADYLGVSIETVRKLANDKDNPLPHIRVGHQFRFRLSDIDKYFFPKDDANTAKQHSLDGANHE